MPHIEEKGERFAEEARELGLEGVVAKRLGSRYQPGRRPPDWRKIKLTNTQDCVILGWTPGQGGRQERSARCSSGPTTTASSMGRPGRHGFTRATLDKILERLEPLKRPTPPIDDPELAKVKGATFVEPKVVCEVEYLEITKSTRKMRAPSFKGLRDDKLPDECVLERPRT